MSETRALLISGYLLGECSTGSEVFDLGSPTTREGPALDKSIAKYLAAVAISDSQALIYGGEECGPSIFTDGAYLMDLELNVTTLVAGSTVNGPRCAYISLVNLRNGFTIVRASAALSKFRRCLLYGGSILSKKFRLYSTIYSHCRALASLSSFLTCGVKRDEYRNIVEIVSHFISSIQ